MIISLIITGMPAFCQNYNIYPFINVKADSVQFYGSAEKQWETFCRTLDTLVLTGKGKINILHLGDSHVQADIFPHELRKGFQQLYPGLVNARGFVFPYSVAKTNNPENYKISYTGKWSRCRSVTKYDGCSFGLAGINIQTVDSISTILIRPNLETSDTYLTNTIKIFRNFDSGQLLINLTNYSGTFEQTDDSIQGFTILKTKEFLNQIEIQFIKNDTLKSPLIIYGFLLDNDLNGISYHSVGLNGAEIPSFNRCSFLEDHVKQINPDIVIVSLGANDAGGPNLYPEDFKSSLDILIEKIKSASDNPLIILTTPGDAYRRGRYPNTKINALRSIILNTANSHNLAVWDHFTIMGGEKSIMKWYKNGLAQRDKLHLTRRGYQLQGQLLFNAILHAWEQSHNFNTNQGMLGYP